MGQRYFKRNYFIVFSLVVTLLTGCSFSIPTEVENATANIVEPEKTNLSYPVPKSIPNVLVDQNGYEMKSTKIALFRGDNLQSSFEVVDAESGEIVYTGDIVAKGLNEETGEYISYGSFSELEKIGTYYIQTAKIGQSYPFVIEENLYDELIPSIQKTLFFNRCGMDITAEYADEVHIHKACHTENISSLSSDEKLNGKEIKEEQLDLTGGWHTDLNGNRDVADGCNIVQNLLLTNELYAQDMTDDVGIPESGNQIPDILDEVKYEIDWLQKMQNSKTGGVYSGIMNAQLNPVTPEATADFASTMAIFYTSYVNYDAPYARNCLRMAELAWKYLQTNAVKPTEETQVSKIAKYNAAAQLFKATKDIKYHTYVKEHYTTVCDAESIIENRELYVYIAYLTTSMKVDTSICKAIMDKWMDRAERIVEEAKKGFYFVIGDSNEDMLDEMLCLSVIDHVITNHEYVTVLESHLHYFLGRNRDAVSYIEGYGDVYSIETEMQCKLTQQSKMSASLLFMLEEIITEDTEEFGE